MGRKHPKLPIGISDFEKLRIEKFSYVDKSTFIEEIVEGSFEVALFARPRRFGKTLNLSMLRYFFDLSYNKPENLGEKHLFAGLDVAKNEIFCQKHMNKYPVVSLSFKGIQYKNHNLFIDNLRKLIAFEFKRFRYLLNSPDCTPEDKITFANLLSDKASEAELSWSLKFISDLLAQHHKVKPYLLIDEYDAPLHFAYANGTYKDCANFFTAFYTNVLKDNNSLHKAILTGILRISKESIFSGLNKLAVHTVLEENYSSFFGLTAKEVKSLLEIYGLNNYYPEIQAWYNGYRFGDSAKEIYNPWSIIKWLEDSSRRFTSYWVNTSKNDIIRTLYIEQKKALKPDFFKLFLGETIRTQVNTETTFDANLTQKPEIFWGFVLQTGYVTFTEITWENDEYWYTLKAPNKEVLVVFKNMIETWTATISEDLKQPLLGTTIQHALMLGDLELFQNTLQNILLHTMSYHDFAQNPENAFHAFMAGLMIWLTGLYDVKSNKETGRGRFDLCLVPKENNIPGYVFEFKAILFPDKKTSMQEKIQKELNLALLQIEEKAYDTELKARHVSEIHKVAIVFYGKDVFIKESLIKH